MGLKSGKGFIQWRNGNYFIGNFHNDKIDGYGMMVYSNGNYFQGFFKDNHKNG